MASHKLRQWRAQQRLSGDDAAALLGLHLRSLYRYETGERWFPDQLKAKLIALGVCAPEDFFAKAAPVDQSAAGQSAAGQSAAA